ncbi:MAG: hypothetical protein COX16_02810 [Deltaproteobacteria bacterium CG23_combo_of_CG06-09_8_20_14_all_51_20]|nr:MAG: hypothetical protein COX16_02810 [Deltaproteobacteria bacterium CG23_combo_of_CG06-09_8_20_14_all_51_20]
MVEAARAGIEDGVLFEAIAETPKCLPDAVQFLTVCSTGNQRLKIINHGCALISYLDSITSCHIFLS